MVDHQAGLALGPMPFASINGQAMPSSESVVLDPSCPAIAELAAAAVQPLLPGLEFHNGVEPLRALAAALQRQRRLGTPARTLHVVAHGRAGAFRLAGQWIDAAALRRCASELADFSLDTIALWSCDVAQDKEFVALLEELTGARVWASATPLGHLAGSDHWQVQRCGGDTSGAPQPPFTAPARAAWRHTLANIIFGTGEGLASPPTGAQSETNWQVVAVPQSIAGGLTTPFVAYNPDPSGLPSAPTTTFVYRNGYTHTVEGTSVTNYWMAPNSGATTLVPGNYNWIAAQQFSVTGDGLWSFNFEGTADNAISFYIDGTIVNTNTENPTISGGTKIGGTYNNFRNLWTFTGSAYLTAGTHTAYMVLNDYGQRTAALIGRSTFDVGTSSVNSIIVNEDSPYAVFTVALSEAQDIQLSLTDGTATGGTSAPADPNAGTPDYANNGLEISLDNGQSWSAYTGSFNAAATGGSSFLVRTRIFDDNVDENDEIFNLNVSQGANAPISGTATINDDDTSGDFYIDVNNITVNEGSDYAVFAVTAPAGMDISLFIASGSATGGTTSPTDGSIDFNNNATSAVIGGLQYSTDNGTTWIEYNARFVIPALTNGATSLLVRTTLVNDTATDNGETFTLTVVPNNSLTPGYTDSAPLVVGTATIKDDGSGTLFTGTGSEDTITVKDDDRPVTVSSPTVNEASPFAVFTVTGEPDQLVSLSLTPGTATAGPGNDYTSSMEVSTDGGTTWSPYSSGTVALNGTDGTLLVRVPILNDNPAVDEDDETFTLTATNTGGTGFDGTATIQDDGNGQWFDGTSATGSNTAPAGSSLDDDTPPLLVSSPTVNEGSPFAVFTVDGEPGQLVSLTLTPGTATPGAGNDYTSSMEVSTDGGANWSPYSSGTVALNGTDGTLLVRVPILNDNPAVDEDDETFTLTATNTGGTGFDGIATIVDDGNGQWFDGTSATGSDTAPAGSSLDDDTPAISVSSITVSEASPYAVVEVSLSNAASQAISFIPSLTSGTATVGTDTGFTLQYFDGSSWVSASAGVTIPAGATSVLLRTSITPDPIFESTFAPYEAFAVETGAITGSVSNPTGATGTVTIKDDGSSNNVFNEDTNTATPETGAADNDFFTVSSVTVNEGSPFAVFTVDGEPGQLVSLTLTPGSAIPGAGNDYTPTLEVSTNGGSTWSSYTSGTVPLDGSGGTLLVRVPILNDTVNESPETFTLTATKPADGGTAVGTATIVDDGNGTIFNPNGSINTTAVKDDDRTVTVTSPIVNEASPYAVFTIDGDPGQLVSLSLTPGTATPGAGNDYTPSLEYSTNGGSSWTTYTSGLVPLNGTGGTMLVRVPILNDNPAVNETDEIFTLTATNTGGTGNSGTATIVDDGNGTIFNPNGSVNTTTVKDDDRPVTVSSVTVNEASPFAVFTVDGEPGQLVSLSLTAGSATPGSDYTSSLEISTNGGSSWVPYASGNVALNGTGGTMLVRVPILNDAINEPNETFILTATNTGGAGFNGTATIVDDANGTIFNPNGSTNTTAVKDDDRPVTVSSVTVNEASPFAVFTVDGEPGQLVSLSLTAGSATPGSDYTSSLEVSFDAGNSWTPYSSSNLPLNGSGGTLLVRVPILNDAINEPNETFILTARNTGGAGFNGTATIVDDANGTIFNPNGSTNTTAVKDDDRPVTVSSVTVNEASPFAVFTVDGEPGQLVSLNLAAGSATPGSDYTSSLEVSTNGGTSWSTYTSGNVALNGTGGTMLVRVPIRNDAINEPDETFFLRATNTGGTTAVGTATIVDDGNGTIFNPNGSINTTAVKDNDVDPTVTITSPLVNEASPYAVFTVDGEPGQLVSLNLAAGTATPGSDYTASLEVSTNGGTSWIPYTAGTVALNGTGGTLLVRVPILNDAINEPNETFTLTATSSSGRSVVGTATIVDDANGTIFNPNGSTNTTAVKDDDRPVTVSSVTVNEASPFAVFTVDGEPGQLVSLSLTAGSATPGSDYTSSLEVSTNGGTSWSTYTSGNVALNGTGGTMLVRVPIRNDAINEPDETFFLRATNTGGTTAVGTATIVDDGNGTIFNPNGSVNTTAIKDNDGTAICPEVSIGNCRVEEPDFGQSRMANLVISLSAVATGDVTVTYATALATQSDLTGRVGSNGLPIGIATANTDFTPVQGSVVIKAGTTSTTVRVPIIGDYQAENDEVLYTRITGVTGGNAKVSPTANRGEILIVDNDCGCNNQVIDRSTSTVAQTIHGGTGNDVLTGSPCPDTINGYGGKDFIAGGAGADALTGGLDADVFAYRAISHSAGSVIDRILDFAPGSGGDRVQFLDSAATTLRTATASAVADGLPKALFNASRSVPATTLSTAISQAFTDKNLALAGNQALATGEAVIVNQASGSTIKSYLIVNVGLASYQSGTDFIADITGWQSTGFPSSQLAVTDFFRSSIA